MGTEPLTSQCISDGSSFLWTPAKKFLEKINLGTRFPPLFLERCLGAGCSFFGGFFSNLSVLIANLGRRK